MNNKTNIKIGLEIHVQLNTQHKLFSPEPNPQAKSSLLQNSDKFHPFTLALPATYPQLNPECIQKAITAAIVLNAKIQPKSNFDRKHYFHHDLPRAYQITQHHHPIAKNGFIDIKTENNQNLHLQITQIHLEDDTAKTNNSNHKNIDFSRAGIPLIEIVTAPQLSSPKQAATAFNAIKDLMQWYNISNANLETANLRCDANLSITLSEKHKPIRTEIKNLNSYKFLENALQHEITRQLNALKQNITLQPQTLHWDNDNEKLLIMREKSPYSRILPEPNIPPIIITDKEQQNIKNNLPPSKEKYLQDLEALQLQNFEAFITTPQIAQNCLQLAKKTQNPQKLSSLLKNELQRLANELSSCLPVLPEQHILEIIELLDNKKIAPIDTYEILKTAFLNNITPYNAAKTLNKLCSTNPQTLLNQCNKILQQYPDLLIQYKNGHTKLFDFFFGKAMQSISPRPEPKALRESLTLLLSSNKP